VPSRWGMVAADGEASRGRDAPDVPRGKLDLIVQRIPDPAPGATPLIELLEPLASLAEEHGQDADRLIEGVLALLASSLDVGLTFLSRIEGHSLHIVQAHDRAGMGMHAGDVVPLCDSY